ncbi:MAG: Ni/Fe-hydrogenase cytochrome b subunit [Acidobacteria bacterium]|nr:Ni/Fe-hydrogenase cytochrome b subunit [Acidobacteriota bacterium]MCL5288924.1 Ni/Fe-hydrogenase cytochrome b subunit [Acidobacteriota bacterium]
MTMPEKFQLPKLTFWKAALVLIALTGLYATFVRFAQGLGASTNLSDEFPWGIWVGFDVLCGVMLAAGGFTLTATVYIFNLERFRPIVRPTVLTAFLGYSLVCVALLFDLGRSYRIWHPLVMWNPRSVLFEVGWCVTLYTTVLALEFAPVVFERLQLERPRRILRGISIPLVIAGVMLSTLHQSSLGSLYLIVPQKLHPFWYSPLLPVFFFISAIAVGLAMTIFESSMTSKHFGKQLELPLLRELGRILAVVLLVYTVLRTQDLYHRGALKLVLQPSYETWLFLLEVLLGLAAPIVLLLIPRVRQAAGGLYLAAVLTLLGFITNRLNVSTTGMETSAGMHYVPKWTELAVTASIIAVGFAAFALAAKHLPIFSNHTGAPPEAGSRRSKAIFVEKKEEGVLVGR